MSLFGMPNHVPNPGGLRSRRPAYPQRRRYILNIARGMVVELEICLLTRRTAPEIEVGFVPDLEIPLRNLVYAVALNQVFCELRDQVIPFRVILRRRDVRVVPEGLQVLAGGQLVRHEAELDERLHAGRQ